MAGQVIVAYLMLFLLFMVFLIGAYVSKFFINVMPSNTIGANATTHIYNGIFGFFDLSFDFIALIVIFLEAIVAWFRPSKIDGILGIFLLLGLVYFFMFINVNTYTIGNTLNANVLLPNSYSFLSSPYLIYVLAAVSVLSIIFNFRNVSKNEGGGSSVDYTMSGISE